MHASWRICLLQAMITGGPLSHLRNFHGFLTNLVRRPPKHEPGGYVRGSSRLKSAAFFRQARVKLYTPAMSLDKYRCCKGGANTRFLSGQSSSNVCLPFQAVEFPQC